MRALPAPTTFVFLIPLLLVRLAAYVTNWAHHAFVDPENPQSDYGSATTTIDPPVSGMFWLLASCWKGQRRALC